MASVMALVSKGIFEQQHRGAKVGDVLGTDRYVSANKGLEPLRDGGDLFLVTVRPPDEQLWLVAVLESPKFDGRQWIAKKSDAAVRDLASVRALLKFSTGSGLSTKAGALGMSLQTPRTLTEEDVAQLRGSSSKPKSPAPKPLQVEEVRSVVEALAPPPADDLLGSAEAALANGDREAATNALLAAWRACRAKELAQLIDIVSEDASRSLPAIDTDAKDWVAQWTEIDALGRAVDVPRLIPGIFAEPIGSLGDRVNNLIERGPDPRVGRALVKFVDVIPTTASSRFQVWTQVFGALPSMIDDSYAADFKRFAKKKDEGGGFYPKYFKWLAKVALPAPAKLDAVTKKRVEAMSARARVLAAGPAPKFEELETEARAVTPELPPESAILAALSAAKAGRHQEAMTQLVSAWTRTRDPELGKIIGEYDLATYPHQPAPPGDHRAWLAREAKRSSLDVQHLLDALGAGTPSESLAKMARLLEWPNDPRIGAWLGAQIDEGWGRTSDEYWRVFCDLVAVHGDKGIDPRLDEFAHDIRRESASHFPYWRPRQRNIVRVRDAFRARTFEPFPERLRARLAELREAFPAPPAHPEAKMMADIVAAPDDDGPRLVFADWLMERGDPLGDWISAQCALARDPSDKKQLAREKALSKTGKARWALLGELLSILDVDPTWSRGMLTRVGGRGDGRSLALLHRHPRLMTVEELTLYHYMDDETAISFVTSPALVSRKRVRNVKWAPFVAMATSARALPVERMEAEIPVTPPGDRARAVDAPGLPALRTLDMWWRSDEDAVGEWILDGALGKRLTHITCNQRFVRAWRAAVAARKLSIEVQAQTG